MRHTNEIFTSRDGDLVTIRRFFDADDQQIMTHVFVGGWRTKTYNTEAGVQRFIKKVK